VVLESYKSEPQTSSLCSSFNLTRKKEKNKRNKSLPHRAVALRQLYSHSSSPSSWLSSATQKHVGKLSAESIVQIYSVLYGTYYYEDKLGVCRPIDCCLACWLLANSSISIYENITKLKIAAAAMHNVTHNGFRLSHKH
jgi:hypothetical protein